MEFSVNQVIAYPPRSIPVRPPSIRLAALASTAFSQKSSVDHIHDDGRRLIGCLIECRIHRVAMQSARRKGADFKETAPIIFRIESEICRIRPSRPVEFFWQTRGHHKPHQLRAVLRFEAAGCISPCGHFATQNRF